MRLQDLHQYSSSLLGLNSQYMALRSGFYINSPCIISNQKIIHTGSTMVLVSKLRDRGSEIQTVEVVDVFYDNVRLNIDLKDAQTGKQFSIHTDLNKKQCPWLLMDVIYMKNKFELDDILDYYGCK